MAKKISKTEKKMWGICSKIEKWIAKIKLSYVWFAGIVIIVVGLISLKLKDVPNWGVESFANDIAISMSYIMLFIWMVIGLCEWGPKVIKRYTQYKENEKQASKSNNKAARGD